MGGAILEGWVDNGLAASDVSIVEPGQNAAGPLSAKGFNVVAGPDDLADSFLPGVVFFAVKPQVMVDEARKAPAPTTAKVLSRKATAAAAGQQRGCVCSRGDVGAAPGSSSCVRVPPSAG